jgi:hypothetical protein
MQLMEMRLNHKYEPHAGDWKERGILFGETTRVKILSVH